MPAEGPHSPVGASADEPDRSARVRQAPVGVPGGITPGPTSQNPRHPADPHRTVLKQGSVTETPTTQDRKELPMNETTLTITGNLAADPELRFTPTGAPVANFTVISTPRRYDRASNEWSDGEPISIRCNLWRQPAENVAESLTRGSRVIVTGRLRSRQWETREDVRRTSLELEVDDIGASLKFATVAITKATRSGGNGSDSAPPANAAVDPWANVRGPQKPPGDEPPF